MNPLFYVFIPLSFLLGYFNQGLLATERKAFPKMILSVSVSALIIGIIAVFQNLPVSIAFFSVSAYTLALIITLKKR